MMDQIQAESIQDLMDVVNNVSKLQIRDEAGYFSGETDRTKTWKVEYMLFNLLCVNLCLNMNNQNLFSIVNG
jgi:hypothetical protein